MNGHLAFPGFVHTNANDDQTTMSDRSLSPYRHVATVKPQRQTGLGKTEKYKAMLILKRWGGS